MLNIYFITMGPGSSPDPNIYYRTKKKDTLMGVLFLALQRDSKIESKLPAGWHRNINFLRSRKCKRIPSQGGSLIQIDGFLS